MLSYTLTDVEQIIKQTTGRLDRRLFVLAGPSGVGKNTIIKELLANHAEVDRVRTYTTRKPREGEEQEGQYHFVSHDEFRNLALAGKLMEADAAVAGHDVYGLGELYSMPADIYQDIPPEKHVVIAEVDVYGARRLKERYPECVTIFLTAPPLELIERIRKRRDDSMDARSLAQRMQTAREQIQVAGEFDYVVYNRTAQFCRTLEAVWSIILAERMRVPQDFDLEAILPEGTFDTAPEQPPLEG